MARREVISPAANVEVLARRIDRVNDSLLTRTAEVTARQERVEIDHERLGRRVDFLVTVKCQEIDAQTRRVLAAAGFSCAQMLQEVRENGSHD